MSITTKAVRRMLTDAVLEHAADHGAYDPPMGWVTATVDALEDELDRGEHPDRWASEEADHLRADADYQRAAGV